MSYNSGVIMLVISNHSTEFFKDTKLHSPYRLVQFLDHAYFVHPSTDISVDISVDMSVDMSTNISTAISAE